jgi:SAM-dependent methyltransferase
MTFVQPDFPTVVINKNVDAPLSRTHLQNKYSPFFLRELEYIYGTEGIISSGGIESVDAMLTNIDLDNKTILDVGCGFGGVDLYLAKKYRVAITGLDREAFMIECAENLLLRSCKAGLKGEISYKTLNEPLSLNEFSDNTFDIVLCKQVLYHLTPANREIYLKEMFRVLKPNGILVIEDWLTISAPYTELVKKALGIKDGNEIKDPFCYLITPAEYRSLMSNAGFKDVNYSDSTEKQIIYAQSEIERLQSSHQAFSKEFGEAHHAFFTDAWTHWSNALKAHEILSGIFIALKSL